MTWRELAEADDLASALTVDVMLGFVTHKMTETKLRITERIKTKFRETITAFQKHKCYETAFDQLTADPNIVRRSWKSDVRFKEHIFRYLLLFDDRSGVEIRPCMRYASENHVGAAIFASRDWSKGSRITTLVGCIAELNLAEEVAFLQHRKNDFSVMYSSRKNCSQLWLGPAAYVNHDCQPNCEFTINCDGDAQMSLEAKTDICKGDEIFIYYGKHFFDVNNSACECFTCELLGRGYFTKFVQNVAAGSTLQPSNSPLRCLTNKLDGTWNTFSWSALLHNGRAESEQKRSSPVVAKDGAIQSTYIRDNVPEHLVHLVSTLRPSDHLLGALPKGSSAGLAYRSLSTAYSLRHTGTRLNRVKATIRAATEAALNAQKVSSTDPSCHIVNLHNQAKIASAHPSKPSVMVKRDGYLRTTRPVSTVQPRRSSMWLRSAPTDESIPVSASPSGSPDHPSSTNVHIPRPSRPVALSLCNLPSAALPKEFREIKTASNFCASPAPPQLDRASSADSVSMPSQLSTAATTPDPHSGCYHGVIESHSSLSMPTLRIGLQCEGLSCSECPSQNSSDATSNTSPACEVEPILDRLLNETRSLELSFANSSSPTPVKRSVKRLTNYDARLIAEANLFAPVSSRRRRSPVNPQLVNYSVDFIREGNVRTKNARSSLSSIPKLASQRLRSARARSARLVSEQHQFYSNSPNTYSLRHAKRRRCQTINRSSRSRRKKESSYYHPHISGSQAIFISETVPDSTSEIGPEPPHIYPFLVHGSDEELVPAHVECVDSYIVSGMDQSCSTTPLRTDPMDDSDLSGDPAGVSHACSFTSFATEPMDFVYADHDYTKRADHGMKTKPKQVMDSMQLSPLYHENYSTPISHFLSSTPPPPVLHPASPPGSDRQDLVASPILHRSIWPSDDHVFPKVAPNSCPSKPASFWAVSTTSSRMSSSDEHLIPFEPRLTVTLKRIGPQSYQISHPDEVYISQ